MPRKKGFSLPKLPPIRANPPPKGAWLKQISRNMKALRPPAFPPRTGGRKR